MVNRTLRRQAGDVSLNERKYFIGPGLHHRQEILAWVAGMMVLLPRR
jgi:hypothetical protein